jgi:hypothetical protein
MPSFFMSEMFKSVSMGNFWSSPTPTKPKRGGGFGQKRQHTPNPVSPSPSELPVVFFNNAACPFSPTPPPRDIKYQKENDDDYIQLPCGAFGAFGCFICMDEAMHTEWKENIQYIEMHSIVGSDIHPNKTINIIEHPKDINAFLDFLNIKDNVCFKAFKKNRNDLLQFDKELTGARNLYDVLKQQLFQSHTTYRTYEDCVGFTLHFKKPVWVGSMGERQQVKNANALSPSKLSHIHILLFQKCQSDLCRYTIQKSTIKFNSLLFCLHPILYALHSNGYIHGDIKPPNIVYCQGDSVPYKLIDFGDIKERNFKNKDTTLKYTLPELLDAGDKRMAELDIQNKIVPPLTANIYQVSQDIFKIQSPPFTEEEQYRLHDLYSIVQTLADLHLAIGMEPDKFMTYPVIQRFLKNPNVFMTLPPPKTKAPSIRNTDGAEGTEGGRKQRKRRSKKV